MAAMSSLSKGKLVSCLNQAGIAIYAKHALTVDSRLLQHMIGMAPVKGVHNIMPSIPFEL